MAEELAMLQAVLRRVRSLVFPSCPPPKTEKSRAVNDMLMPANQFLLNMNLITFHSNNQIKSFQQKKTEIINMWTIRSLKYGPSHPIHIDSIDQTHTKFSTKGAYSALSSQLRDEKLDSIWHAFVPQKYLIHLIIRNGVSTNVYMVTIYVPELV